jgi:hypothetical protein
LWDLASNREIGSRGSLPDLILSQQGIVFIPYQHNSEGCYTECCYSFSFATLRNENRVEAAVLGFSFADGGEYLLSSRSIPKPRDLKKW